MASQPAPPEQHHPGPPPPPRAQRTRAWVLGADGAQQQQEEGEEGEGEEEDELDMDDLASPDTLLRRVLHPPTAGAHHAAPGPVAGFEVGGWVGGWVARCMGTAICVRDAVVSAWPGVVALTWMLLILKSHRGLDVDAGVKGCGHTRAHTC